MGEVYRARDTRLKREVAVKMLAETLTGDAEHLARFEREAELLAALNHPAIAQIYGLEESAGGRFLVLELVEGDTLAERLAAGPLPISEALEIGRQIAEALEAAHRKGIVHRDLKPGNVKITPEGRVKGPRFRSGQGPFGDGGDHQLDLTDGRLGRVHARRNDSGHSRLHESRTGARAGARCSHGHLVFRLRALRGADRSGGVRR